MTIQSLKRLIKKTPVLRIVARWAERVLGRWASSGFSSSHYWDARYRSEGNSGSGSYNRLAKFKADVLNEFVRENIIGTIIEFGSGDGSQLMLAQYPSYLGVDISPSAIERTRALFANDTTKQFIHVDELRRDRSAELTLSLDVIYHLVEDQVFEAHMERLFAASRIYVVIYASNFDRRDAAHVRHRKFTDWIESNRPDFELIERIRNPYPFDPRDSDETSLADFFVYQRVASAPGEHG
jgi:SAM-dependent methyltransferase